MTKISEKSLPKLARGVKLKFDEKRNSWLLNGPERVVLLDEIAHAVISRCAGSKSVGSICDELSKTYNAPRDEVARDVLELLDDMATKGYVRE
jgi:pyrroloquinoline quinone biosynthesis protein D